MNTLPSRETRPWLKGPRAAATALVATAAVIVAVVVLTTSGSSPDTLEGRGPASVLFAFQDAYNAGDLDAAADLFDSDALLTGYPFTAVANGADEIRLALQAGDRELAPGGKYEMTELVVSDQTITFRHSRTDVANCATAPGHRMVVRDGRILEWEWPKTSQVC